MAAAHSTGTQADVDQGTGADVRDEGSPQRAAEHPTSCDDMQNASTAGGSGLTDNDVHVTQDGASAAEDHSLSPGSTGRAPSSSTSTPAQPSPSSGPVPATVASPSKELEKQPDSAEAPKQKGPSLLSTTFTTPVGKRKRDAQSASEGAHTASSITELSPSLRSPGDTRSSAKRKKLSFLARLLRIFAPCIYSSGRDHVVDIDEGAQSYEEKKDQDSPPHPTRESSTFTTGITPTQSVALVAPPPAVDDEEVIVPPTPTKQLLPRSETNGLTSGAVQPPGSTSVDISQEHSRSATKDTGEESDGSFIEEEALRELIHVDDSDDDEQRLIRKGGAGIPIDSDGTPQPLLPPVLPQHLGRKCLVLDLDETLVHSSLKPVPAPDYVVPVEIESFWHNFYVLKRPGVDVFLKKMGEIYEVVVFTASLSKYADPVLDRLDPDRSVTHRLFRESCYNHRGNYVKDLSQLGRPIGDTIILDNSPASYIFHPNNAVPVSSWFNDPHDTELTDLCPFLTDLGIISADVRGILNPAV